jgi:hypothetical protein
VISGGAARATIGSNLNAPEGTAGELSKVLMQGAPPLIHATTGRGRRSRSSNWSAG